MPDGIRNDGYMNLMSGLGAPGLDRTVSSFQSSGLYRGNAVARFFQSRFGLHDITNIYVQSGLAQKIVDRPSDDAFQRGVEIEDDVDEIMSAEYDRLSVMTKMADAVRWTRLYGAAAILLIAKDGGELDEPLNLNALDTIEEIRTYDLTCIRGTGRYYDDFSDPTTFGKIEYYEITPWNGPSLLVHETRLIPVAGDPLPTSLVWHNKVWWAGRSNLEGCLPDILRYQQGLEWSIRLLERKQQAVYSMEGLATMFAQGDDTLVQRRINMVDMVRGNLNSIVVDKNDTYNILNASMDGVKDCIEEYKTALSASSNIPITILFGQSSRGLNQTGSGDLEAYYGMVSHIQNVIAKPALEKLTSILWTQKSIAGKAPENWKIAFNPLWMPTDAEIAQAELYEAQATTQQITALTTLMTEQILTPEEVRKIVVNKFEDFEFSEELPVFPDTDIQYAEGVDNTMMDVPGKPSRTPGARATSNDATGMVPNA